MGAVIQASYDSALPHLTQHQASPSDLTKIIAQSCGETKPQDGNNVEPPANSAGKGLKIRIRRIRSDMPTQANPRVLDAKTEKPTAQRGRPKARKLVDKTFKSEPLTDDDWARISATYWNNRPKETDREMLALHSKREATFGSSAVLQAGRDPHLPETIHDNSQGTEEHQLTLHTSAQMGSQALRRSSRNRK
ncbi:hypothetical protein PGT21_050325 [Puccinia graminis f. sp. tritici]|uniref:Uncharacterized protein n=1 Tax=Puccinia graminis f. sp. tritici TaxID=56615 RepID=A0A5B0M7P8_PUCGR|nr:hypothetical protein PGT21_050325 [Puccinia graminis f. sp. tritici]